MKFFFHIEESNSVSFDRDCRSSRMFKVAGGKGTHWGIEILSSGTPLARKDLRNVFLRIL